MAAAPRVVRVDGGDGVVLQNQLLRKAHGFLHVVLEAVVAEVGTAHPQSLHVVVVVVGDVHAVLVDEAQPLLPLHGVLGQVVEGRP